MARGDLKTAQALAQKFLLHVGADDRVALWTLNTRYHDLTKASSLSGCVRRDQGIEGGLPHRARKGPKRLRSVPKLHAALTKLSDDYPAGAVNLRDRLPQSDQLFDGKEDRQHVILFLGSGQSIAGPIDAELRGSLCKDMVNNQIAFYSVPLGGHLDPYNLHGFANGTGGKVVRHGLGGTPETCGWPTCSTRVAQPDPLRQRNQTAGQGRRGDPDETAAVAARCADAGGRQVRRRAGQ